MRRRAPAGIPSLVAGWPPKKKKKKKPKPKKMTVAKGLELALSALHKIAMGVDSMKRVEDGNLPENEILRRGVIERAMNTKEIGDYAIETWEHIVEGLLGKTK